MEITIPKEILALHKLCSPATETEGTPGMSRMRLFFEKAQGRAQVSNGQLACEATWVDPEGGLDGQAQVSLPGVEAKFLSDMASSENVTYNDEEKHFTCGAFTLPATQPRQSEFQFMDEALDGWLKGLQPQAVKGMRFDAKAFKLLADLLAKLGADAPMVFYGAKRAVCCEVEKGELAFKFLIVPKGA